MNKYQLLSLKCQLSHAKIVSGAYKFETVKKLKKMSAEDWDPNPYRDATEEEKLRDEIKKMTNYIAEIESMIESNLRQGNY